MCSWSWPPMIRSGPAGAGRFSSRSRSSEAFRWVRAITTSAPLERRSAVIRRAVSSGPSKLSTYSTPTVGMVIPKIPMRIPPLSKIRLPSRFSPSTSGLPSSPSAKWTLLPSQRNCDSSIRRSSMAASLVLFLSNSWLPKTTTRRSPPAAGRPLRDPAVERGRVLGFVLVELVVAEDHDETLVEGRGVAVQRVQGRHHLLPFEHPAGEGGEEEVAGMEHQQVGVLPFELGAQGPHASHAANRPLLHPFDPVDVVDREQQRRPPAGPRRGGGGRALCRAVDEQGGAERRAG